MSFRGVGHTLLGALLWLGAVGENREKEPMLLFFV